MKTKNKPGNRKYLSIFLFAMLLLLAGCGKNGSKTTDLEPVEIEKEAEGRFGYGDFQEDIEKIVGTESRENGMIRNWLEYEDGLRILYRYEDMVHKEGKKQAVMFHIKSSNYSTYKGIKVGDSWEEVKNRLDMVKEQGDFRQLLFDGEKQVDPDTMDREERSWILLSYKLDENGTIENIIIGDILAGKSFL